MKLLYKPFSMLANRLAKSTSRRLVDRLWRLADKRRPPTAEERAAGWGRLAGALLLEGAVFRAVSGLADHAARSWFARLTGRWPGDSGAAPAGEQAPDAER